VTALEAQKELVQFLLKRLKACALESMGYYGALLDSPKEIRERILFAKKVYAESRPFRERMEEQFQNLDSLIERVEEGVQEEEWSKLLEQFDPIGPVN
jgi:hypothetical protein